MSNKHPKYFIDIPNTNSLLHYLLINSFQLKNKLKVKPQNIIKIADIFIGSFACFAFYFTKAQSSSDFRTFLFTFLINLSILLLF